MELTIEKIKGNVAQAKRETKELDLYVGSRSVRTNDRKRSRGQATVRVVFPDTTFGILQLRAMLAAKLEQGKFYHVTAIVDVTVRRDGTSRVEIAEVTNATEIEGFSFEDRVITYVRPEAEVEAPAEELVPSID